MFADVGPIFRGVGAALLTFFDDRGELDLATTADHAERLVDLGVSAVVVAGTTGEATSLDNSERTALLEAILDRVGTRVPVISGTGAESTARAAQLTRVASAAGAHGALVLSPPGVADSIPYYRAVAQAARGMPLLAYHYPAVAPPGIPLALVPELEVRGLKDSSGDAERLLAEVALDSCDIYVGSSTLLSVAGACGCAGAILALANLEPERCALALAGDPDAQRVLGDTHLAAARDFPRALKLLVQTRWGTPPSARVRHRAHSTSHVP